MTTPRRCHSKTYHVVATVWIVVCVILAFLVIYSVTFGAEIPEFPFQNTAQTSGVPGWVQTAVGGGTCAGMQVFLLQFTNPEGQQIQIFSDAEKKIIGAWYPDPPYQIPTHLWFGTIDPVNGKITMGDPVPFDLRTYPTPCVYWEGKSGA